MFYCPYSQAFTASGGSGSYVWRCDSVLPDGLSFDGGTATLSGTPTMTGDYSITLSVSDDGEATWTAFSFNLTVTGAPSPLAISGSLTGGVTGGEYSQSLFASGGAGGYFWQVAAGSLPEGLALDPYTGAISGTPVSSGTSSFTVTVVDGDWNSVSADYQITVYDPPAISGSLPNGMANVAYSQTLGVEGGSGSYSWALSGQPCGLEVDAGGTVSGTTSTPGTCYFTVTVTDLESGGSAQAVYEITIGSAPITVSNISASAGSSDAVIYLTMTMPYGGDSYCADIYMGGVWYGSGSPDENGSVAVSISGLEPNSAYAFEIQASGNVSGFGSCSVWDGAGGFQTGADSVLEFSAATYQANENDGSVTITINRSGSCAAAVSVDYSGDGEGTVTFDPGETSKTFTIPITNDGVFTGDATFTLVLANPQGGAAIGTQSVAVLTIIETDPAPPPPELPPPPADPTPSVSMWDVRVEAVSGSTATISWAATAEVPSGSWWYDSGAGCWQGSWSWDTVPPENNVVNYSGDGGSGSAVGTYDWGTGRVVATISGLAPGYNYSFTAESSHGGVSASGGGSFFVGTPSLTLANVTANYVGCDIASVSWEVSWPCGGFNYALYSSTDGSSFNLAAAGSDGTSAMLGGLQPNQTYYYCVLVDAYDSDLNYYSATSEVQSFTTLSPIHIISAPTATPVSGNSVIVSWEVANATGQTATHRVSVLAEDGTEVASGEMESGDSAVSIQVDGLTPGYNYRYVVTSKINDDPGWFETVGGDGDPLTFTIALTISDVGVNWDYTSLAGDILHVCLNWTVQPAGATSSHTVFRDADTWMTGGTEAGDGSGLVTAFLDLNPGDRCPVWVQSAAVTANKDSPIIVEGLPLVTITNLLAVPLTPTNALVSWSVDSHGAAISNVVSYWSGANPINTVTADFSGGVVIATLTNLAANTAYDFFVLSDSGSNATTTAGAFATLHSNVVSKAWVRITNAPTRGVVDVATRSTTLSWGIENNSNESVIHTVNYSWESPTGSGTGQAYPVVTFAGETQVSMTIRNLVAGATYTFDATSFVAGYESDPAYTHISSGGFTVTTQELPPLTSAITIFNVSANPDLLSDTMALIIWNVAYTNINDYGTASHFVLVSSNAPPATLADMLLAQGEEDDAGNVWAVLSGLAPGQSNYFSVQSILDPLPGRFDVNDNGGLYYSFTNTVGGEIPTDPLNETIAILQAPVAGYVSDTNAVISWQVSPTDWALPSHFVIYSTNNPPTLQDALIVPAVQADESNVVAVLTQLQPECNYYFGVQSVIDFTEGRFAVSNAFGVYYPFTTLPAGNEPAQDNFSSLHDGIPDWWKLANGFSLFDSYLAEMDPDGDGFSNLEEFLGATGPQDAGSKPNGGTGGGNPGGVIQSNVTISVTFSISSAAVREWMDENDDGSGQQVCGKLTCTGPGGVVKEKEITTEGIGASYWYMGLWTSTERYETFDIPAALGETYTFTFAWIERPAVEGYWIGAGVGLSSTNCFLWPGGMDKSWSESTIWSGSGWSPPEGAVITGYDYDGESNLYVPRYVYVGEEYEDGPDKTWTITIPMAKLISDPETKNGVCAYSNWFSTDDGRSIEAAYRAEISASYTPASLPNDLKNLVWVDCDFVIPTNSSPGVVTVKTQGCVWDYTAFIEDPADKHPQNRDIRFTANIEDKIISPSKYMFGVRPVFEWLTVGTHKHGPGNATPHEPDYADYRRAYKYIRWKYGVLDTIHENDNYAHFANEDSPNIVMGDYVRLPLMPIIKALAYVNPLDGEVTFATGAFHQGDKGENRCASMIGHELVHTTQNLLNILNAFGHEVQAYQWQVDTKAATGIDIDNEYLNFLDWNIAYYTTLSTPPRLWPILPPMLGW